MCQKSWKTLLVTAAVALASCSSEPAKTQAKADGDAAAAKAPAGPPQPIAAKAAFWEMYTPAHAWAADLQPLSLMAGDVAGVKNADGKAGLWTATFVSPSKRAMRTYVYAVTDQLPDITKGVKGNLVQPWGGPTHEVMPFQTSDFTVDSEAAFKTASTKAADWLKQKDNADKPVTISLGAAARYSSPVWVITFGTTKAGYRALINATTGDVITK
jgi:hypothetical protein